MHIEILSVKWRPFCSGGDELINYYIMAGHAIVVVKDTYLLFIMETLLFWHCGND